MLILTRYNNQRIVVIAPDKSELWVTATESGVMLADEKDYLHCITEIGSFAGLSLEGEQIAVTYLETRGKSKPIHRIGIDAPKDYLILREELLNREEK
jgi:sRNA-binding carbon storage regulator CsrA